MDINLKKRKEVLFSLLLFVNALSAAKQHKNSPQKKSVGTVGVGAETLFRSPTAHQINGIS